jgi:hypothetical protein
MELYNFYDLRDNLQKIFKKQGYKLKIIDKKIFVLRGRDITICYFFNPREKYFKIYYINSFNQWIYKINTYTTDKRIFMVENQIKRYVKELEDKINGLY